MFVVNLGVGFLRSDSVFLQLHLIIGYDMMVAMISCVVQHNPVAYFICSRLYLLIPYP